MIQSNSDVKECLVCSVISKQRSVFANICLNNSGGETFGSLGHGCVNNRNEHCPTLFRLVLIVK